MWQFIREVFSEGGVGSSKRVFGGLSLFVVLCCVGYLVCREGASQNVTSLLEFLVIISTSLLGLTSIVSVFKDRRKK